MAGGVIWREADFDVPAWMPLVSEAEGLEL